MITRLPRLQSCSRSLVSVSSRSFSSSPLHRAYDDTIPNLKIDHNTRVIYQGFTGRVSTSNAQQSLEYGTQIVGGTTPGKEGEHLGLPLLPSVQAAADKLRPDASAVFVAAHQAGKAIEDAIAAEIPLIVAVAEFIPLHDMLRVRFWSPNAVSIAHSRVRHRYPKSSTLNRSQDSLVPMLPESYHLLGTVGSASNRSPVISPAMLVSLQNQAHSATRRSAH